MKLTPPPPRQGGQATSDGKTNSNFVSGCGWMLPGVDPMKGCFFLCTGVWVLFFCHRRRLSFWLGWMPHYVDDVAPSSFFQCCFPSHRNFWTARARCCFALCVSLCCSWANGSASLPTRNLPWNQCWIALDTVIASGFGLQYIWQTILCFSWMGWLHSKALPVQSFDFTRRGLLLHFCPISFSKRAHIRSSIFVFKNIEFIWTYLF